jgi:LPPG:FO 2-phospho-L-lactate transferase
VILLSGGTGGAKLARGLLDAVGEDLVVIANTGDDVEAHGGHVSPDPDLVTFWLADRIDERGWGLRGDTFAVMDGLRELGEDVWFNLGDRDLALCLRRARRLAEGARLTEALDEARRALGVPASVLPMSDQPVRTHIRARGAWHGLQEFLIRERGQGPVEDVRLDGVDAARPVPEALEAIAAARAIVVGPSNPVISIGPILAVPGMREALEAADAPVVGVSPLVGGQVLKGPTDVFMQWAGHPLSSEGIAAHYGGLLDGLVADERADSLPTLETGVDMPDAAGRRRVAGAVLGFAGALRSASAGAAARPARTGPAPVPDRPPGDGRRAP